MKLFCRHKWNMDKQTCRLYNAGIGKEAMYKCEKCGKEKWFDTFDIKPNKYVFKEYDKGNISDGYHTFNELYHHRMLLFSIICNTHTQRAWRSWKHSDGTMFDYYFIVGITTPKGDYSYHYHKDDWDYFNNVKEVDFAPKWDGHQPKDIDRLLSLL